MSTKKALIEQVAIKADLPKTQAAAAVEAALGFIRKSMESGEEVRIPEFGTFKVAKRKAREGRNPATGETIAIPAHRVAKFSPSKVLMEMLNASEAEGGTDDPGPGIPARRRRPDVK